MFAGLVAEFDDAERHGIAEGRLKFGGGDHLGIEGGKVGQSADAVRGCGSSHDGELLVEKGNKKRAGGAGRTPGPRSRGLERDVFVHVRVRPVAVQAAVGAGGAVTEAVLGPGRIVALAGAEPTAAEAATEPAAEILATPGDGEATRLVREQGDRKRLGQARIVDLARKEDLTGL